jgi:hypothetical protein
MARHGSDDECEGGNGGKFAHHDCSWVVVWSCAMFGIVRRNAHESEAKSCVLCQFCELVATCSVNLMMCVWSSRKRGLFLTTNIR